MKFEKYIKEFYKDEEMQCPPGYFYSSQKGKCMPEGREIDPGILHMKEKKEEKKFITRNEVKDFKSKWKNKLKSYGVTDFRLTKHFDAERLNHPRNVPPLTIKELDFVLDGFLKKMGSQFKKDVENVKNHTAKRRGLNKKQIPENELEFAVTSNSTKIKFVFALKQDNKQKGTAIVLPMTVIRDKKFKITKGEQVMVERKEMDKVNKYLPEMNQKQRELFALGRKVQNQLTKMHVMTLKPKTADFAQASKALGISKADAIKAWNVFTWGE